MYDSLFQVTPLTVHQYHDSLANLLTPTEQRRLQQLHEAKQARAAEHPAGTLIQFLARFAPGIAVRPTPR